MRRVIIVVKIILSVSVFFLLSVNCFANSGVMELELVGVAIYEQVEGRNHVGVLVREYSPGDSLVAQEREVFSPVIRVTVDGNPALGVRVYTDMPDSKGKNPYISGENGEIRFYELIGWQAKDGPLTSDFVVYPKFWVKGDGYFSKNKAELKLKLSLRQK